MLALAIAENLIELYRILVDEIASPKVIDGVQKAERGNSRRSS
jgi:hypothetical protein